MTVGIGIGLEHEIRRAAVVWDVVAAACLGIVIALLEFAVYHA